MRGGGLTMWIKLYLGLGIVWCLLTNLIITFTRAPSAFQPAAALSGTDQALAIAKIVAGQVLLWPAQLYEKAIRPIFG